jgi:hypothetical protein
MDIQSMPPKQQKLSVGDRAVTALLAGVFGFGTMVLIWFLVLNLGAHADEDLFFPFFWTWIAGGLAAAVGFAVGPERMVDGFEGVWSALGKLMFWQIRDEPTARSPRRRAR